VLVFTIERVFLTFNNETARFTLFYGKVCCVGVIRACLINIRFKVHSHEAVFLSLAVCEVLSGMNVLL
jgi:hypothetical protein